MTAALQFANTVILPDLALSPTLSTPAEEGGVRTTPPAPQATALAGQIGPYRIERPRGAGGMGAVYEASDVRTGQRVAVKSLLRMGPAELHRFKYEFRSMAEVGHPNLVTLYELVSRGELWLIAMEYVEGIDLCAAIRSLAGLPDGEVRLRSLLRQLALGVQALHDHGLLHRDLKPSNVLVTPGGRVVILDFGLVAEIARGGHNGEAHAGTPLYMSPEQCAGQLATAASDWYAVGVMLYEALTHKLPFSGGYAQIFLAKQCEEPPPPEGEHLPPGLGALIGELLRRDPAERASGAHVLAWCGGTAPQKAAPPVPSGAAALHGRAAERAELERAFAAAESGLTACVYLRGGSGVGKTGLVHSVLAGLQARGDVVALTGRCYEHESVPFKAFDSLVDALADYLGALNNEELMPLLGAHTGELARVFPVLQRVGPVRELAQGARPAGSEQESRRKAFAALKRLLYTLAVRHRLVLFLDDLHFSDTDSVRLLSELLAPPDAPPLLLIAAYRGDWPGSPVVWNEFERLQMRVWPELHVARVDVGRLAEADARQAARTLLTNAGLPQDPWAAAIAREAEGDSFLVEAMVHELAQRADDLAALAESDLSYDRLLGGRVDALDPDARATLELVAVAGQPMSVALLGRALRDPSDLHARLARLHGARLVTLGRREHAPCVEPYHDRVRALVVRALDPGRVAEIHRLLAETQLSASRSDPEFLARHLFAAGDLERAGNYAELAGKAAAEALAFDHAAELYALALRCAPDSWRRMAACAHAKVNAGRGLEAAPMFLEAATRAPEEYRFGLRQRACEQLFAAGETASGEQVLGELLAGTGLSAPANGTALAEEVQSEVAVLVGSDDPPASTVSAAGLDPLQVSEALWAAAKGFLIHTPVRAAFFAARSAALAREGGDESRFIRGLIVVRMIMGFAAEGGALEKMSARIEQYLASHDDPYAVGLSAIMEGIGGVGRGRWSNALRDIDFGLAHLRQRCPGVAWECNFGALMLMSLLESRGELRAIALRSAVMSEQAKHSGDAMVEFIAAYYTALVLLAADAPDQAREVVARAARLNAIQAASAAGLRASIIESQCALYLEDAPAAWAHVERAAKVVAGGGAAFTRNQLANFYNLRGQVALAMAEKPGRAARQRLLAAVTAEIDALRANGSPTARANASVLLAGRLALGGAKADSVIRGLRAAAAAYDAADMPLGAACVRYRLGAWVGGEEGAQLQARSEAFMRLQAIACPAKWVGMAAPGLQPPRPPKPRPVP